MRAFSGCMVTSVARLPGAVNFRGAPRPGAGPALPGTAWAPVCPGTRRSRGDVALAREFVFGHAWRMAENRGPPPGGHLSFSESPDAQTRVAGRPPEIDTPAAVPQGLLNGLDEALDEVTDALGRDALRQRFHPRASTLHRLLDVARVDGRQRGQHGRERG